MTTTPMPLSQLAIPEKTLTRLSQVGHSRSDMQFWVNNLPIMNTGDTGKRLYQTLGELALLQIDDDDRFELLEILEPAVTNLIRALSHHLQHQSVKLPHQARRAAVLSQALHLQLAANYKVVAVGTLQRLQSGKVGFMNLGRRSALQLAAASIQRALAELTRLLRHVSLLYAGAPDNLWMDMHGLFHAAWTHDLIDQPVRDRHLQQRPETTVRETYLRGVMLAASQTNKLRPAEIEILYQQSEGWARLLQLETSPNQALLVCNADDLPPIFRHRTAPRPGSWFIRSDALAQHLQTLLADASSTLPVSLMEHLLGLWRRGRERMFERRPCDKPILVCLGLSAAHYFLSGQREFRVVVKGNQEKKTAEQPAYLFGLEEDTPVDQPDAWQISYATVEGIEEDEVREEEKGPVVTYQPYQVQAFNVSPGGYGIRWPGMPPAALRPGEAIAISEERGKGWNVGLLHWVRLTSDYQVEAGLELLSAQARTCGVCRIRNLREDSDYLRGFLIPEMKSLDQPATLVTAATTFTVGSEVKISLAGQTVLARLTRRVLATPSIHQYEFAVINANTGTPTASQAPDHDATLDSNIDAMWDQLKS